MNTVKVVKQEVMEVDEEAADVSEDEVVAELDCFHIPLNRQTYTTATLQFMTDQAAKLEDCVARMKPVVKHLEVDFENGSDRSDGIKNSHEYVTTFAGKATSETEVLNHAIGFVENGRVYFLEVDDSFKMRRKVTSSNTGNSDTEEPSTSKRNLSPVRVKFARAETDAQRKRREQSSYFKHQQAEQEAWRMVSISHEAPNFPLSLVDTEAIALNGSMRTKMEVDSD